MYLNCYIADAFNTAITMIGANIEILRNHDKLVSISVSMPIWCKSSEFDGNIRVKLPLLAIDTIAEDENDVDSAVKEAIQSFCIASERFGEGIEKELQALGWKNVDENGEAIKGFCVSETDQLLERLLETGDNYVNQQLAIEEQFEHA